MSCGGEVGALSYRPYASPRQIACATESGQEVLPGRERIERELAVLRQSSAGALRIGCTPALGLSPSREPIALQVVHPHLSKRLWL